MTKAASASSISFVAATTSFALGMVAAVPELLGGVVFRRLRPAATRLMDFAPVRGRCLDGYDLISDLPLRVRLLAGQVRS